MWRMLTGRAADLQIELPAHDATDTTGTANWVATYTFAQTGRKVVNDIQARFRFAPDGRFAEHVDDFSFHTWSKQALGTAGDAARLDADPAGADAQEGARAARRVPRALTCRICGRRRCGARSSCPARSASTRSARTSTSSRSRGRSSSILSPGPPPRITLKVDPELGRALVDGEPAISPGYHMNKRHWITIDPSGDDRPGPRDRPRRGRLRPRRAAPATGRRTPDARHLHAPGDDHARRRPRAGRGLPGVRRDGLDLGPPAALHGLRARRVLRRQPQPACHARTSPQTGPSGDPLGRARRGLVLVLRGRGRLPESAR